MRSFAWLIALWLTLSPALADSAYVAPTATGQAATGQIPGTATNDCAAAGKVGEYVQSIASGDSATNTFTNASPTVVTWTAHPFPINCASVVSTGVVNFTNSGGALPTGISAGTNYYFVPIDVNTGHIATTVANALAGTFVNTSSTGTGTQTGNAEAILGNSTTLDMGGAALTAGDWECFYSFGIDPAAGTTTSLIIAWVGATSVTTPAVASRGAFIRTAQTFTASQVQQFPMGPARFSLSATTNVFFSASVTYAVSTNKGYGVGNCIRAR